MNEQVRVSDLSNYNIVTEASEKNEMRCDLVLRSCLLTCGTRRE